MEWGQPNGASGRVLVCDDTEQIRRLLRVNLELDCYEVVEAVDGLAALEILPALTEPLPDASTVDVVMPRRDVWWMVSAILFVTSLAPTPILLLSLQAAVPN